MAKRIAIVDIGSNSARVVIFQRTSRYGFHLIAQKKAAVRISENSYSNGGNLQEEAIERTFCALKSFKELIADYKARKVLIVATAAVRNAPNRAIFIQKVRRELKLNIKVIDGKKEAYFGAIATKNLLPVGKEPTISVDIGGGSTDIALINNGNVIDTISIDIGTIKIKELFFDKNINYKECREFIKKEFSKIPKEFKVDKAIAIGGVLRAFAKSIIDKTNYSFKKIHAYEYSISKHSEHIKNILNAKDNTELQKLYIKSSRFDTIKEGLLIFSTLLEVLEIDKVITSGVGIREGIFLHDMLRNSNQKFPKEINPSIVSITDRLDMLELSYKYKLQSAKKLYQELEKEIDTITNYQKHILDAIKISNIGKTLTIYNEHKHTYYIANEELNWQYKHEDMLLIATILRSKGDKLIYKPLKKEHKKLLPSKKIIKWLGFIYTLIDTLYSYSSKYRFDFKLNENTLNIYSNRELPLFLNDIKTLKLPKKLKIKLHSNRLIAI